jgi:zinc D-Ala-D-Ala carboxypeptidase
MSVRDAAERHPRRERGDLPTDRSFARVARSRRTHATPISVDRPRLPVSRSATAPRRSVRPLVVCLAVLGLASIHSIATVPVNASGDPALASATIGALAAATPVRQGAVAGIVSGPEPAAEAPEATAPSGEGEPDNDGVGRIPGGDPLPPCTHDDLPATHAGLDDWATTLVDTAHALPDGYKPPDLVLTSTAGIEGWGLIRSFVIDDLRALTEAARAAGNPVALQSAYRSRDRQTEVYAGWVASSGESGARRFSARPGHSEHQLGTALDLRAAAGGAPWSGAFGSTAAGRWLSRHAHEFGFLQTYPQGAEAISCYGAEAWHIRYVGRELAAQVHASGLPLRAWLWEHAASR